MICPCCGQAIAKAPDIKELKAVRGSTMSHLVLDTLINAYPRMVAAESLLDIMYRGAVLPEGPLEVLRDLLPRLKRRIKPYGWTIGSTGSGRNIFSRYKLEILP